MNGSKKVSFGEASLFALTLVSPIRRYRQPSRVLEQSINSDCEDVW